MTENTEISKLQLEKDILALELQVQEKKLNLKQKEVELESKREKPAWLNVNPALMVGIIVAIIGLFGNIVVATVSGRNAASLEDRKLQSELILTAIQTGDQEIATQNLEFFLDAGLLRDDQNETIRTFLEEKKGPVLPSSNTVIQSFSDFEVGDEWTFLPSNIPGNYTTDLTHSGDRSILLGTTDPNRDDVGYSQVIRRFDIPSDASSVIMAAYTYHVSHDLGSRDLQFIWIFNEDLKIKSILLHTLSNDQIWEKHTFDLTGLKGQTIYISFGVINTEKNDKPTALYVDDVCIESGDRPGGECPQE